MAGTDPFPGSDQPQAPAAAAPAPSAKTLLPPWKAQGPTQGANAPSPANDPWPEGDQSQASTAGAAAPSKPLTGYAANIGAGPSEAVAQLLGTPVDLATAALNLGSAGINRLLGTRIPQITQPFGGTGTWEKAEGLIGANPQNVKPGSAGEALARAIAGGATSMVLPGGVAKAVPEMTGMAEAVRGALASGATPSGAIAGAAGGGGGQAAADVVPEPYKPLAEAAGNLIVGGGAGAAAHMAGGLGEALTRGIPARLGVAPGRPIVNPETGEAITDAAGRPIGRNEAALAGRRIAQAAKMEPGTAALALSPQESEIPGFEPTLGQGSGDLGVLSFERELRNRYRDVFIAHDAANNAALSGAIGNLAPEEAAGTARQFVRAHLDALDTAEQAEQSGLTEGARAATHGLGGEPAATTQSELGASSRERLEALRGPIKEAAGRALDAVDPDGTLTLRGDPVAATANGLIGAKQGPQPLDPLQAARQRDMEEIAGQKPGGAAAEFAINPRAGENPAPAERPVLNAAARMQGVVSFRDMRGLLGQVGAAQRAIRSDPAFGAESRPYVRMRLLRQSIEDAMADGAADRAAAEARTAPKTPPAAAAPEPATPPGALVPGVARIPEPTPTTEEIAPQRQQAQPMTAAEMLRDLPGALRSGSIDARRFSQAPSSEEIDALLAAGQAHTDNEINRVFGPDAAEARRLMRSRSAAAYHNLEDLAEKHGPEGEGLVFGQHNYPIVNDEELRDLRQTVQNVESAVDEAGHGDPEMLGRRLAWLSPKLPPLGEAEHTADQRIAVLGLARASQLMQERGIPIEPVLRRAAQYTVQRTHGDTDDAKALLQNLADHVRQFVGVGTKTAPTNEAGVGVPIGAAAPLPPQEKPAEATPVETPAASPQPKKAAARQAVPYAPLPRAPQRLVSWLKSQGGVQDAGGDVRAIIGGHKGRPGLINKSGMPLDDAALRAWEAGYFPDSSGRPSTNDLLDAIEQDMKVSPRYSAHDEEAVNAYHDALAHNAEIDRLGQETGIDPVGKTRQQFWDAVAAHQSEERAQNEALNMAFAHTDLLGNLDRDAELWSRERGEDWSPELEYGVPPSLEDLERAGGQKEAGGGPDEVPGGPEHPGPAGPPPGGLQESPGPGGSGAGPGFGSRAPAAGKARGTPAGEPGKRGQVPEPGGAGEIRQGARQAGAGTQEPGPHPGGVGAPAAVAGSRPLSREEFEERASPGAIVEAEKARQQAPFIRAQAAGIQRAIAAEKPEEFAAAGEPPVGRPVPLPAAEAEPVSWPVRDVATANGRTVRVRFPDENHAALYDLGRRIAAGEKVPPQELQRAFDTWKGFVEHDPEGGAPFASSADVPELASDMVEQVESEADRATHVGQSWGRTGFYVDPDELARYAARYHVPEDRFEPLPSAAPAAAPVPSRTVEQTEQGPQMVLPGAERSARQAAASREAAGHGRIVPRKPQQEPGGLFAGTGSKQLELLEEPSPFAAPEAEPNFDAEAAQRLRIANRAYADYKQRFRRGPVGEVLASGNTPSGYRLGESQVVQRLFRPGAQGGEAADSLIAAAGSPEHARDVLGDYPAYSFRRAAEKDGMIDPRAADRWLSAHKEALDRFPQIRAQFETPANAARALADSAKRWKATREAFENTAVRHYLGAEPQVAIQRLMGSPDPAADAARMMRFVAPSPAASAGVRRNTVDWLLGQIRGTAEAGTSGERQLSKPALQRILAKPRQAQALRTILGPEGFATIQRVSDALDLQARSHNAVAIKGSPGTAADLHALGRHAQSSMLGQLAVAELGTEAASHVLGIVGGRMAAVMRAASAIGTVVMRQMQAAGMDRVDQLAAEGVLHPEIGRILLSRAAASARDPRIRMLGRQLTALTTQSAEQYANASAQEPRGYADGGHIADDDDDIRNAPVEKQAAHLADLAETLRQREQQLTTAAD